MSLDQLKDILEDEDYFVPEGSDLDWLIAQLASWPTRVHPDWTTNISFLMKSAAATLSLMKDDLENAI